MAQDQSGANKVNKLYIDVGDDIEMTVTVSACKYQAFNVTQLTVGTSPADRYGRFLQDRPGVASSQPGFKLAANAVSAWFQQTPLIGEGGATCPDFGGMFIGVDFVRNSLTVTSSFLAALPSIDPATTRHFRVRLQAFAISLNAAATHLFDVVGTVFVQRQHSIEV